jgi:hypothetical protein
MPLLVLESKFKVRDLSAVAGASTTSEFHFFADFFLLLSRRAHRLCLLFFSLNFNPSCGIFRLYGAFSGAPSTASEPQFFIEIFCV